MYVSYHFYHLELGNFIPKSDLSGHVIHLSFCRYGSLKSREFNALIYVWNQVVKQNPWLYSLCSQNYQRNAHKNVNRCHAQPQSLTLFTPSIFSEGETKYKNKIMPTNFSLPTTNTAYHNVIGGTERQWDVLELNFLVAIALLYVLHKIKWIQKEKNVLSVDILNWNIVSWMITITFIG